MDDAGNTIADKRIAGTAFCLSDCFSQLYFLLTDIVRGLVNWRITDFGF